MQAKHLLGEREREREKGQGEMLLINMVEKQHRLLERFSSVQRKQCMRVCSFRQRHTHSVLSKEEIIFGLTSNPQGWLDLQKSFCIISHRAEFTALLPPLTHYSIHEFAHYSEGTNDKIPPNADL